MRSGLRPKETNERRSTLIDSQLLGCGFSPNIEETYNFQAVVSNFIPWARLILNIVAFDSLGS